MMKGKRTVSIALVCLLAFSIFAATSRVFAPPVNPLDEILSAVNNIYSYLTGMNAKLDKGSQVLTRTETVKFSSGTPPSPYPGRGYYLVTIVIEPDKAADFRVTLATFRDFTLANNDRLGVALETGYLPGGGATMGWPAAGGSDSDLNDAHWQTEFTARRMYIVVDFGTTLTNDIFIMYSYTVTTDAEATIVETITPPPSPTPP